MLENLKRSIGYRLRHTKPGLDAVVSHRPAFAQAPVLIALTSPAFDDRAPMPARFTADGEGLSPPLDWTGVPPSAQGLVLLVEDPDAPFPRPLVHAIVLGLDAGDGRLTEGELPSRRRQDGMERMGRNSFSGRNWLPPTPPPGHGPHRYCFQMFALDRPAEFPHPPGRGLLVSATAGHVVARGLLIGTYMRP
jgi:Raf kinase inhibitor-like YbhB/YbcL family protein